MTSTVTVVVVDDEETLRNALVEYLSDEGFVAIPAGDGSRLREIVQGRVPDIVVLDIAMPREDGFALARWLRSLGPRPGIIFSTALGTQEHRTGGLELGADDYLVKPYDLRELLGRIRRLAERLPPRDEGRVEPAKGKAHSPVLIGCLALDQDRRVVLDAAGRPVPLTAGEFELLEALATRPNRVLSRQQLRELAAGQQGGDGARGIDIRIARLRRKLEAVSGSSGMIRTVKGEGYTFVPGEEA